MSDAAYQIRSAHCFPSELEKRDERIGTWDTFFLGVSAQLTRNNITVADRENELHEGTQPSATCNVLPMKLSHRSKHATKARQHHSRYRHAGEASPLDLTRSKGATASQSETGANNTRIRSQRENRLGFYIQCVTLGINARIRRASGTIEHDSRQRQHNRTRRRDNCTWAPLSLAYTTQM